MHCRAMVGPINIIALYIIPSLERNCRNSIHAIGQTHTLLLSTETNLPGLKFDISGDPKLVLDDSTCSTYYRLVSY